MVTHFYEKKKRGKKEKRKNKKKKENYKLSDVKKKTLLPALKFWFLGTAIAIVK